MKSETMHHAETIWNYLSSFSEYHPSDILIVCCSYDLRICDYACSLMKQGQAEKIIFSGASGNWTRHLWKKKEAHVFMDRALQNGIDPGSIILEEQASNIGENIAFSKKLLPSAQKVIFITKPNTILRVKLTFPVIWPGIQAYTACPDFQFPGDISNIIGVFGLISEMVGDLQRIEKYPEYGYQIPHSLPEDILKSYHHLIDQGFTHHMIHGNDTP